MATEERNIIHLDNVKLREDGRAVVILDQSLLPGEARYEELETPEKMYDAIFHLKVRGAPAIGIFAAYCMAAIAAVEADRGQCSGSEFIRKLEAHGEYLRASRPTAVNLDWAVKRVMDAARKVFDNMGNDSEHLEYDGICHYIAQEMRKEAARIHEEDINMCKAISEYGLSLIKDGDGILTHCNAGPLATSKYGTALGPILLAAERGMSLKVFADETRPLLQGARLTAYELSRAGVDVTLICDNMASMVMKNGWIQACFVGCDRVAANGDTANKIGTSAVAIMAKHYGIPFYVLGPTSTIDTACPSGMHIPIELRAPEEITDKFYKGKVAPDNIKCYNPAFDVTDHSLITAIITEKGICRPPFEESLRNAADKNL